MNVFARLLLALSIAPLLAAQTQFSTDVLAMNPLGFWPLNGNAADTSGHGNNGSLTSGVTFTGFVGPLGVGPAAVFASARNGTFSVVGAGASNFSLGTSHAFTAMAWIRTIQQSPGVMAILGKFDPAVNVGWGLVVDNGDLGGPQGGGRLALVLFASEQSGVAVETAVGVNDGGWHLVAATYDGSGTAGGIRLYIDGIGAPTVTVADSIAGGSIQNSAPFTIGNVVDGSAAFEGNINEAAVFGVALTPAQNLQLAEDAQGFRRVLGQFAFGGGWRSAIYFMNNGTVARSFPVSFTGDDGSPMTIASIGGSSTTITLPPGGTSVIEAPNQGPLVQGYVGIVLPTGVNGYGVFRQSVAGTPDQEAVVPLGPAGAQGQVLLYDDTNDLLTAVAIVNPSQVAETVTVTASDSSGNPIGTSSVDLPPFGKTAVVLRNLPGLDQIAGHQGTAFFKVSAPTNGTGAVAILGLRFISTGSAFTSIPASGRPAF